MQPAVIGQSVSDWVSALGQVAGAVGTFVAVVVALWVARRDGRWRRAEQSDREVGQARLVTADMHYADGRWWVRTTNHSTAPVFGVEVVEVHHPNGISNVEPVPGAPAELLKLAAGEAIDRAIHPGDPSGVVVLRFLDAAGLRWRWEGTAQPQRVLDY